MTSDSTISATQTIQLEVTEAPVISSVNQAPFFVEELPVSLEAYVGGEWSYSLPETEDPEELEVTTTVDLGTAVMFMTFDTETFSIAEGVTLETMVSTYSLEVVLKDAQLAERTYLITFNLLTSAEQESMIDSDNTSEEVS
jgi:hypothetical protein